MIDEDTGTVTITHDITDRVTHEDKVTAMAETERSAYEHAQCDYHQIRHRIANPLTIIRGAASQLDAHGSPILLEDLRHPHVSDV